MGQVCSSRRSKRNSKSTAPVNRPPSRPAPPPYESRLISPITPHQSDLFKEKEQAPELSTHPALRDRSISTTISIPAPAHLLNGRHPSFPPARRADRETSTCTLPSPPQEPITASSIPLWRWSNTQCRSWLASVLITYGGRPSPVAHRLADAFKGWGPNLYMKEWKEWNAWLGADGQAIFALLMECHAEEGAVPRSVEIEHYLRHVRDGEGVGVLEIGARSRYPLKGVGEEGQGEKEPFVGKETEEDAKRQVASEWGKGRLKKLTEEREKLRAEREKPVGEGDRRSRSWLLC
ncbi:hypothetical protein VTL71DRAFT_9947 [Oculimacula yallundae]|uniref:Uncharacterized protein n=1 Tax=Oculimacula yallundae TaxID=86028 RepID=A0ABR4BR26_9HELO